MKDKIIAWHNDAALKTDAVARMRAHRDADEIIQGDYQIATNDAPSGYRGCFIGCLLPMVVGEESLDWHALVQDAYGIPHMLGRMLDRIFEGLPAGDGAHAAFAVAVVEAVPVGADLSMVTTRLLRDILSDEQRGVWRYTADGSAARAAVRRVGELYDRWLAGDKPSVGEWRAARDAAYAAGGADVAAGYAAGYVAGVAYVAAGYVAYVVGGAGGYAGAVVAAAYDVAGGYVGAAARDAFWAWVAERVIHHVERAT